MVVYVAHAYSALGNRCIMVTDNLDCVPCDSVQVASLEAAPEWDVMSLAAEFEAHNWRVSIDITGCKYETPGEW